ncbi:DUF4350 domain-containing protein [Flavobacterium sp.]|uniref:DUF4350 domain-containing protein n=1 Tax=Flavobacterium sp. TaxID=239 RepID=UPI0035286485
MSKTIKIYVVFLVAMMALIVVVDANRPRPVNWMPSFDIKSKIPFGLKVFQDEKDKYFKGDTLTEIRVTPYEFFDTHYDYDTLINTYAVKGTFLSIDNYYNIDESSTDEILYFVSHGNNAFLSMNAFSQKLQDSLHFDSNNHYFNDRITTTLANNKIDDKEYQMKMGVSGYHFSSFDTLKTTVLGYHHTEDSTYVNFIKVPYGNGHFYLHTQPFAFTNYYLLKDRNYQYAENVLSYIPKGTVFWYPNKTYNSTASESPLRFILSHDGLKWAWYLFLIGMIIFMIFNAKRKQRIIPIVKPLENTTVDFTKTIGNLYFQEGNHDTIMEKKIIYFLEKLRQDYLIDTQNLDDDFIKKVHQKTGKDISLIEKVVLLIKRQRKTFKSTEADLIELNNTLEKILENKIN